MKNTSIVDLHVHTPASIDYLGQKNRKGYLDLFSAYKNVGVDVIAITDHNTLNGYIEYKNIRESTRLNYELNSPREESADFLKQLKSELICLDSLTVIPGVEISVYPGIHIILLFDENIDTDDVTDFLRNKIGLGDGVDLGDPASVSQYGPLLLLQEAQARFGDNFFSILPHVDSSKGAWNDLEGISRAELFSHPSVLAVQIINPDTRKRLEQAFNNVEYKRAIPIQIIQASDYHGAPSSEPGHQHSIFESEGKLNFVEIRDYFKTSKHLRISADTVDEDLQNFVEGKKLLSFDFQNNLTISNEHEAELIKALSACLNSPGTLMRINCFNFGNEANSTSKELFNFFEVLRRKLDPDYAFKYSLLNFSYSKARQRFIVDMKENQRIRMAFDIAFVFVDGNVRPAKAWEIERMVSRHFYNRYGKKKQAALVESSKDLLMISNSLPAFSIASRVDQKIKVTLPEYLSVKMEKVGYNSQLESSKKGANGVVDGDFYLLRRDLDLKGGRLGSEFYFRFSLPTFKEESFKIQGISTLILLENSIIICPDGGVCIAEGKKPLFAPFPVFVFTPSETVAEEDIDVIYGITAYLKSSFLLWYISTIYETDDLFTVLISTGGRIPIPRDLQSLRALSTFAKNILVSETSVLRYLAKTSVEKEDVEKRKKEIERHNAACSKNMRLIDKEVFGILDADEPEIREIYRVLKQLDLYDYGISMDIDAFIKEAKTSKR